MSNPIITRVADAMLDDPFCDDIHLLGTTQHSQRVDHYTQVALEALAEGLDFKNNFVTLNGSLTDFRYIRIGNAHYAQVNHTMGKPYEHEAQAKTVLINAARAVLFGLGPKE